MGRAHTLLLTTSKLGCNVDVEGYRSSSVLPSASVVWTEKQWQVIDAQVREKALRAESNKLALSALARASRKVLCKYSSSFFIVTRFLPPVKRAAVELVYAAVRYPDEIVDTFDLSHNERIAKLQAWRDAYDEALRLSVKEGLAKGLPVFIVGFAEIVRRYNIPFRYYHSFVEAMKADVEPRYYSTMSDLIDSYIYGSAIVVGYFLSYIYGSSKPSEFNRALESSRNLGIALQLTNFLRDVREDRRRGRIYIPIEMLHRAGLTVYDVDSVTNRESYLHLLRMYAEEAEQYYTKAERDLDAFSPDCLAAIRACIGVYRTLNHCILSSPEAIHKRISLPWHEKFQYLPTTKYWKIPFEFFRTRLFS